MHIASILLNSSIYIPDFNKHTAEVGADEVGAVEVGIGEVGVAEVGVTEVGAAEVGAVEVGVAEVGVTEVGAAEIGVAEVGAAEVGDEEVGAAEVGAAEVGIFSCLLVIACLHILAVVFCFFVVGLGGHVNHFSIFNAQHTHFAQSHNGSISVLSLYL